MDAALALLIVIVEVEARFRTSSALVPSITAAELIAAGIAMAGVLVAMATQRRFAAHTLSAAASQFPASVGYLAWLPCVAAAGLTQGSADCFHALKDSSPSLVLLVLFLVVPATRARLDRAAVAVSLVGLGVGTLAVAQAWFGGPYITELGQSVVYKEGWDSLGEIRHPVVGPFGHPNALALYLVPVGLLAVGAWFDAIREGRGSRVTAIHGACGATAVLAVLISGAKLGAGTMVIGIVLRIIASLTHVRCSPARAAAALGLLIVSLAAIITAAMIVPLWKGVSVSPGTLVERWFLDVSAVTFLGSNPGVLAFGGGLDTFIQESVRGFQVHNEFLSQVLKFGLVSGILFLAMVVSGFRGLDRRAWSNALALCGLVVMLLVEPAGGAQAQGTIMTIIGLCLLRRRAILLSSP